MKIDEIVNEGWKGALAGAGLMGAVAAGVVATPPISVNGVRYDRAAVPAPANAKTVEVNGKKYKIWADKAMRNKQHHLVRLYAPVK